jgi:hypothetical protein
MALPQRRQPSRLGFDTCVLIGRLITLLHLSRRLTDQVGVPFIRVFAQNFLTGSSFC